MIFIILFSFSLTVPTMASLVIEATSLSNFLAQADANFPFKTPLLVQALDTNSRVITDGPDSTLVKTFFAFFHVGTIL